MLPSDLKKIGKRLFGKQWQSAMGRALGVHRITIWRWLQDKKEPIPPEYAKVLQAMDPGPAK